MRKRQRHTKRGLYYQALAEGYKLLKPGVADTYQLAADYYEHSDLPVEANKRGEDEGTATR